MLEAIVTTYLFDVGGVKDVVVPIVRRVGPTI